MQGFGFVSMNYRLRWDYKIYDQLVDIVSAIRWITENGKEHGLDASKIILMGSDSGAHLASLVVADSSYLKVEGMDGSNIKAVVAIDTLSFDITRLMKELGSFLERRKHQLIFGADEKVWKAASPIHHIANSQTLPPFALLYNPEEEASTLQAKGFAKALSGAGVQVVMIAGSSEGAAKTDELIGTSGNVASGALMAFIRSLI
jgi:acetyl esterase/lipase